MECMRNGSIRYISMENWMAYTGPVVLQANPGVNIIAASNGSGKSAIVCAIALSLGFDPGIVSRGDNIRSFIKRGCTSSVLKVGLADEKSNGSTIHIERRIFLTDNPLNSKPGKEDHSKLSEKGDKTPKHTTLVKNEWYLNGKSSSLESIRSMYRRLNIQLENLLTFLAQANVGKFAAMSQKELFRSTMNAIDPAYVEELDALIEVSSNLKAKVSERKAIEEGLQSSQKKLSELSIISDDMVKLKDASLYRSIVRLKLFQVKLGNINKAHESSRKRLADSNNEIYSHEIKHRKMEAKYNRLKSATTGLYAESKNKLESANSIMLNDGTKTAANNITDSSHEPVERAFYDSLSMLSTFENDFKRAQSRQSMSESNSESIQNKIESIKKEIDQIKSKIVSTSEVVDRIARCKVNEEALQYRLRRLASSSSMSFADRQFESLMNFLPYMKRENFSRYLKHCRGSGTKPHLVVVNDVKVRGRLGCCIVEDCVGNYLDCVLLQSSEYERNLSILKSFKLPIVTVPATPNVLCKVTKRMKGLGVIRFVHEMIECAEDTKQCLSSLCQINETFVVDENFYDRRLTGAPNSEQLFAEFYSTMLEEISSQIGKRVTALKYFVGSRKHLYKHFTDSNYFMDSEAAIYTTPKVLVDYASYGSEDSCDAKRELELELDQVVKELSELNRKLKEHNDSNKFINKKLYALWKQQISLEKSLRAIGTGENRNRTLKDWERELEKLRDSRISEIGRSIVTAAKNLRERIEKSCKVKASLIEASDSYNQYSVQLTNLNEMENTVNESKKELESLKASRTMIKNTIDEQTNRIESIKSTIDEAKRSIRTSEELFDTGFLDQDQVRSFSQIKKDFENRLINMSESDLEKELVVAEDQLRKLEQDDVEEINLMRMIQEERSKENSYREDLAKIKQEIADLTSERDTRFGVWETKIKLIVREIDANFGSFMKYIGNGSDGQVRLQLDSENINESRILILVKFDREKDLLPLTASYQSGGERGVTTMVYILSVQNLTKNPFFVIDEINQGLDSHYERKLMKLLLRSPEETPSDLTSIDGEGESERTGNGSVRPQYFILTPQLISGYDLSNATLHFPLNGPGIESNLAL